MNVLVKDIATTYAWKPGEVGVTADGAWFIVDSHKEVEAAGVKLKVLQGKNLGSKTPSGTFTIARKEEDLKTLLNPSNQKAHEVFKEAYAALTAKRRAHVTRGGRETASYHQSLMSGTGHAINPVLLAEKLNELATYIRAREKENKVVDGFYQAFYPLAYAFGHYVQAVYGTNVSITYQQLMKALLPGEKDAIPLKFSYTPKDVVLNKTADKKDDVDPLSEFLTHLNNEDKLKVEIGRDVLSEQQRLILAAQLVPTGKRLSRSNLADLAGVNPEKLNTIFLEAETRVNEEIAKRKVKEDGPVKYAIQIVQDAQKSLSPDVLAGIDVIKTLSMPHYVTHLLSSILEPRLPDEEIAGNLVLDLEQVQKMRAETANLLDGLERQRLEQEQERIRLADEVRRASEESAKAAAQQAAKKAAEKTAAAEEKKPQEIKDFGWFKVGLSKTAAKYPYFIMGDHYYFVQNTYRVLEYIYDHPGYASIENLAKELFENDYKTALASAKDASSVLEIFAKRHGLDKDKIFSLRVFKQGIRFYKPTDTPDLADDDTDKNAAFEKATPPDQNDIAWAQVHIQDLDFLNKAATVLTRPQFVAYMASLFLTRPSVDALAQQFSLNAEDIPALRREAKALLAQAGFALSAPQKPRNIADIKDFGWFEIGRNLQSNHKRNAYRFVGTEVYLHEDAYKLCEFIHQSPSGLLPRETIMAQFGWSPAQLSKTVTFAVHSTRAAFQALHIPERNIVGSRYGEGVFFLKQQDPAKVVSDVIDIDTDWPHQNIEHDPDIKDALDAFAYASFRSLWVEDPIVPDWTLEDTTDTEAMDAFAYASHPDLFNEQTVPNDSQSKTGKDFGYFQIEPNADQSQSGKKPYVFSNTDIYISQKAYELLEILYAHDGYVSRAYLINRLAIDDAELSGVFVDLKNSISLSFELNKTVPPQMLFVTLSAYDTGIPGIRLLKKDKNPKSGSLLHKETKVSRTRKKPPHTLDPDFQSLDMGWFTVEQNPDDRIKPYRFAHTDITFGKHAFKVLGYLFEHANQYNSRVTMGETLFPDLADKRDAVKRALRELRTILPLVLASVPDHAGQSVLLETHPHGCCFRTKGTSIENISLPVQTVPRQTAERLARLTRTPKPSIVVIPPRANFVSHETEAKDFGWFKITRNIAPDRRQKHEYFFLNTQIGLSVQAYKLLELVYTHGGCVPYEHLRKELNVLSVSLNQIVAEVQSVTRRALRAGQKDVIEVVSRVPGIGLYFRKTSMPPNFEPLLASAFAKPSRAAEDAHKSLALLFGRVTQAQIQTDKEKIGFYPKLGLVNVKSGEAVSGKETIIVTPLASGKGISRAYYAAAVQADGLTTVTRGEYRERLYRALLTLKDAPAVDGWTDIHNARLLFADNRDPQMMINILRYYHSHNVKDGRISLCRSLIHELSEQMAIIEPSLTTAGAQKIILGLLPFVRAPLAIKLK